MHIAYTTENIVFTLLDGVEFNLDRRNSKQWQCLLSHFQGEWFVYVAVFVRFYTVK